MLRTSVTSICLSKQPRGFVQGRESFKTWDLNMLKWPFCQSEKKEGLCMYLRLGCCEFLLGIDIIVYSYNEFCCFFLSAWPKEMFCMGFFFLCFLSLTLIVRGWTSLQLFQVNTSHMSLNLSQFFASTLQPELIFNTNLSHFWAFLFICPIYFGTTAVLAAHENTWAVEGTVHVPQVIFDKSLTRQFDNSQIHASNSI